MREGDDVAAESGVGNRADTREREEGGLVDCRDVINRLGAARKRVTSRIPSTEVARGIVDDFAEGRRAVNRIRDAAQSQSITVADERDALTREVVLSKCDDVAAESRVGNRADTRQREEGGLVDRRDVINRSVAGL